MSGKFLFKTVLQLLLVVFIGRASVASGESDPHRTGGEKDRPFGLTLEGRRVDPVTEADAAVTVLLFISVDCPISNKYAPEMRRLEEIFSKQGARFWMVYPDSETTAEQIRQHQKEYGLSLPALRDPEHSLVRTAKARVTPEAAVFSKNGELLYHGRIDDRFAALGVQRGVISQRDLQAALENSLAGKPVAVRETVAVGCKISSRP